MHAIRYLHRHCILYTYIVDVTRIRDLKCLSLNTETPSGPQTVCTPPPTGLCTYVLFSDHSPWPSFTWSTSAPTAHLNHRKLLKGASIGNRHSLMTSPTPLADHDHTHRLLSYRWNITGVSQITSLLCVVSVWNGSPVKKCYLSNEAVPAREGSHPPPEDVWPLAREGAGTQVAQALRLGCCSHFPVRWGVSSSADSQAGPPTPAQVPIAVQHHQWFYFSVFQFPRIFFKIFSPWNTQRRASFSDIVLLILRGEVSAKFTSGHWLRTLSPTHTGPQSVSGRCEAMNLK